MPFMSAEKTGKAIASTGETWVSDHRPTAETPMTDLIA